MKSEKLLSIGILIVCLQFISSSSLIAQQTISGSFSSNGQARSYLGAIPSNPQTPLRLVILFCGANENASQMVLRGFNNQLGNNSMVIYPEPSGQAGFDNITGVNDFQMVEDLISRIDSIYSIDTSDICIGGFSNGGIFTYKLACNFNTASSTRAYKFRAIAVVSGAMVAGSANVGTCPIVNNLPLIAFHGTQDPVIQYNGGQIPPPVGITSAPTDTTIRFWAITVNGCNVNPTITALPDLVTETPNPSTVELLQYNCSSAMPTRFYRITGGRHAWPSGNANLDNFQSRNLDIVASQLIANFFNQTVMSITNENIDSQTFSIFPNPFTDELSIESNNELKSVRIINTLGYTVHSETQLKNSISLKQLASGVYFLNIEDKQGRITVKRIIKE